MANVGTAAAGKPLIGSGVGASPTFVSIGKNSGLTANGVIIGQGNGAFTATSVGTANQVLTSNGTGLDPTFQTGSGSSGLLTVTGTLTNSQIKNLHATPIVCIPAPAAGSFIAIQSIRSKLNYGGNNPFTAAATQAVTLYYGTSPNIQNVVTNSTLQQTSNYTSFNSPPINYAMASSLLDGIVVNLYNASTTEIGGNAANDNTISYSISYYVITI